MGGLKKDEQARLAARDPQAEGIEMRESGEVGRQDSG